MVSKGFTGGLLFHQPRIDLDLLSEHSEGLVLPFLHALPATFRACLPPANTTRQRSTRLPCDGFSARRTTISSFRYLGIETQKEVTPALLRLSRETGIPMVATNDAHYLRRGDADTQAVLMCIQTNSKIADGRPFGFETNEFYMKSTEEMEALFCRL